MSNEADLPIPDPELVAECEQALGYQFQDKNWLLKSLTHASIAQTRLQSNERMEFLGDAVLGAVVCDRLFALFPEDEEGQMTQMKSEVVSRTACAQLALALGLDRFVQMGKGLHQSREIPLSVLAGVFESVIAAIYLDGGYKAAFDFISGKLEDLIQHAAETAHIRNSKSQLQQLTQRTRSQTPTYELLQESGPDHSKCFLVQAIVGPDTFPPAWGSNKKEAEQKAALNALCFLQGHPIRFPADIIDDEAAEQKTSGEDSASDVSGLAAATAAAAAGLMPFVLDDNITRGGHSNEISESADVAENGAEPTEGDASGSDAGDSSADVGDVGDIGDIG